MDLPSNVPTNAPRATTRSGIVEGIRFGPVEAYLGIPYAAAPVGDLRWRPPQAVPPWPDVRPAHHFGPSAWQPVARAGFGPWTHEFVVQNEVSEDCLYLNVWTTREANASSKPVLVWLHGGAFAQGSGSVPIYDGQAIAARGVVMVTFNYRLGVLGFLAHPELAAETATSAYGNFGLQDQLAALRWVQANIEAFGGDPTAVTIAGQSAGAVSVHMLVAAAQAHGLMRSAIAQSGPPTLVALPSRDQAETQGLAFAAQLKASGIAALRALDVQTLTQQVPPGPNFMPMQGGALVAAWPPASAAHYTLASIPMLVGQTADENSGLDPHYANSAQGSAYRQACLDRWLVALWLWAEHRSHQAQAPVYAYHFEHVTPGPEADRYGAFHTSEVPYTLGNLGAAPERGFTAFDEHLSAQASGYWLNFVKHGNPNGEGLPYWPAFEPAAPTFLRLGAHTAAGAVFTASTSAEHQRQTRAGGAASVLP